MITYLKYNNMNKKDNKDLKVLIKLYIIIK